ncbi:MAG TPA: tRNA adenosine(34) deaminase TadA [Thermodesulfobacteriota bacterium]|nr:tRNA adenosine(34) deaminase TadA [Thermodesulfobacteriota bacterium]
MISKKDEQLMRLALAEAEEAGRMGEVPVGAVVVDGSGRILSTGRNMRESSQNPTDHAEIIAIREASRALGSWRLEGTAIYVTLEPCMMCMGAIINARIERLVFGARDPKAGAVASVMNPADYESLNHRVEWREGVLEEECSSLLRGFFKMLRARDT